VDATAFSAAAIFLVLATRAVLLGRVPNTLDGRSDSLWTSALGELGGWRLLPVVTLGVASAISYLGRRANAVYLVAAVGGVGCLSFGAKLLLQPLGAANEGPLADFPSTHAACTAAFAIALAIVVCRASQNALARILTVCGAAALTIAMAAARVIDGRHSVAEAVGGLTLAVAWLVAFDRLWHRPDIVAFRGRVDTTTGGTA